MSGQDANSHAGRQPWMLDAGVAVLCLLLFWLPVAGEPAWLRPAQVGLMALVGAGSLGRTRWPLPAFVVVALSTLVGVLLGVSSDPFVAAGWTLYRVALTRGSARTSRVLSAVLGAAIVAAVTAGSAAIVAAVRYGLVSVVVVAAAWTLGSVTRRAREQGEHAARAERERAVVAERLRLARDLHDIVSHSLGTIAIVSAVGRRNQTVDVDSLRAKLMEIEQLSGSALTEMQSALGALREDAEVGERSPQPGLGDLNTLIKRTNRVGTATTLTVNTTEPLPAGVELAVYRIVQEGLTNVVRHAPGAGCAVVVDGTAAEVRVDVTNDGRHPELPATRRPATEGGLGLIGLRERIELMGGAFHASPDPGGGFSMRARLPVPPANREEQR